MLLERIEQLRTEKKMSYSIASSMQNQLEAGQKTLEDRLDKMTNAKKEVDDKLGASNILSESLHREVSELMAQKEAHGVELQRKIYSLEEDLRKSRSTPLDDNYDTGDNQEQVNKLVQDLAEMKSEKDSTEKRLAWEKSTKRGLRQQILTLQEHARAADKAKQISENELKELQEQSDTQTSESMEEVAEKLRQQVQSLQQEKGVTLNKLSELEEAVATGELDFGEGGRVREAYVDKLRQDIDKLETSVDNLSSENKLLLDSKIRLEGEMSKNEKSKFTSLDDEISNLSRQTRDLTEKLSNTRKEATDAKVAQEEEKDQVLDLQARMDKTILQLATLKSSTRVNMARIKGEHEKELKAAKDSSASLVQMELDDIRNERDELRETLGRRKEPREELFTLEETESSAGGIVRKLRDMLSKSQDETAALKTALTNEKNDLIRKDEELAIKKKELIRKEEELGNKKNELIRKGEELDKLKHSLEEVSRVEREAEVENSGLKQRIEVSERAHADQIVHQEQELIALRKELESEKNHRHNAESKTADLEVLATVNMNRSNEEGIQIMMRSLENERGQRETTEHEAINMKATMEQYNITMDHMRLEVLELRSKKDETVTRLKDENQKLQKDIQAMVQAGSRAPSVLIASGEGPEPANLTPMDTSHDMQTSYLDDVTASAFQGNCFLSSEAAVGNATLSSASVLMQRNDTVEELERMRSISDHFKLLYEIKNVALKETQMERDALRLELHAHHATL
uniref:Uncharacterized protein n=1 Tax=Odontella aurita TaxID=265563 RepID=A0A7S4JL07_9STRA